MSYRNLIPFISVTKRKCNNFYLTVTVRRTRRNRISEGPRRNFRFEFEESIDVEVVLGKKDISLGFEKYGIITIDVYYCMEYKCVVVSSESSTRSFENESVKIGGKYFLSTDWIARRPFEKHPRLVSRRLIAILER